MSLVTITIDPKDIVRLANLMAAAGKETPAAISRALRHTGDKARTQVRRETAKQLGRISSSTGSPYAIAKKAINGQVEGMSYILKSRGGNIRIKYYAAKETPGGVTHKSPKRGSPIAHGFRHGGRFPKRKGGPHGGKGFYERTGRGRFPLAAVRSDVFIPDEMVSGGSASAFFRTVEVYLPDRLAHELLRMLGG